MMWNVCCELKQNQTSYNTGGPLTLTPKYIILYEAHTILFIQELESYTINGGQHV